MEDKTEWRDLVQPCIAGIRQRCDCGWCARLKRSFHHGRCELTVGKVRVHSRNRGWLGHTISVRLIL